MTQTTKGKEVWVVCLNCNFRRHGSNSEMLKTLHEERFKDHRCEIRYQESDTEHVPFDCENCGVYHTAYSAQIQTLGDRRKDE